MAPMEELGNNEIVDQILDKGIYFISIEGKNGTGKFSLYSYSSTLDINYEINDPLETATPIANNKNIEFSSIIDNPLEVDYYKIECNSDELAEIEINSPSEENYTFLHFDGENLYKIDKYIKLKKGTNYIKFYSEDSNYSQLKPYTIKNIFLQHI